MKNTVTNKEITDNEGLLVYPGNQSVGYIISHQGKSFDPGGYLEGVTQEMAEKHNNTLSQAEILGLDKNCEVGMCGTAYLHEDEDGVGKRISTWMGALIADQYQKLGRGKLRFYRNDMELDIIDRDEEMVTFKRVA